MKKSTTKNYYIYMFLDGDENPLYIGRTINLVSRIETQHFKSDNGNLSKECINVTDKILYHKCVSEDDMKIKERYLINTLSPKYNKRLNNNSRFSFSVDFDWKLYSINKEQILKKQEGKRLNRYLINHQCEIEKSNTHCWLVYSVNVNTINKYNYLQIKLSEELIREELKTMDPHFRDNHILTHIQDYTFYFALINNELYVHNYHFLSYYIGNFKEIIKRYSLDEKHDFISIIMPRDEKLYPTINREDLSEFFDGGISDYYLMGKDFIRFSTVLEHQLLDIDILIFIYNKLSKMGM